MDPSHLYSLKFEPQHAQLCKRVAALVTAVVTKLDLLETTHLASNSGCKSSNSSGSSSNASGIAESSASHILWNLLLTSNQAFSFWKYQWPAGNLAEYHHMRQAMHCLMLAMLQITRTNRGVWHAILPGMTLEYRSSQVMKIVSLPMIYNMTMTHWPTPNIISELSALPADFYSLFCCLMVEHLDDLGPTDAQLAAFQHRHHLHQLYAGLLCKHLFHRASQQASIQPSYACARYSISL